MGRDAAIWIGENVINLLATGTAATITGWRAVAASLAAREAEDRASVREQRRVNAILLWCYTGINLGLATLGSYLIFVAARRTAPVDPFILIGTGAFALVWVPFAALAIWHWRATARIADMARAERAGGVDRVVS